MRKAKTGVVTKEAIIANFNNDDMAELKNKIMEKPTSAVTTIQRDSARPLKVLRPNKMRTDSTLLGE